LSARRVCALASIIAFAALASACGVIPFTGNPALNYVYGSNEPLRIAFIDETGGTDWSPAIAAAAQTYGAATPQLVFQDKIDGANIVMTFHRYTDTHPPELQGYNFPPGAGGFATVYDPAGLACNFPPSPLPMNCSGEIARSDIYLNDIIPAGPEIESRRERLIIHEVGHAMGLQRHSPDLDIDQLASRYGWE
jgi:hypothetical protein